MDPIVNLLSAVRTIIVDCAVLHGLHVFHWSYEVNYTSQRLKSQRDIPVKLYQEQVTDTKIQRL